MLNRIQAQNNLKNVYPEAEIKAWAEFDELFLFRVEHPDPLEKDWDPFFSVDNITGEVRDFSMLTDITTPEFEKLKWNNI